MRIDDSLAKGLCKRFLREASERNEAYLERLSRASTYRKKAALYKLLPTAKDAFLFSYLGGSNKYPFMALMRLQEEEITADDPRSVFDDQQEAIAVYGDYLDLRTGDHLTGLYPPITIDMHVIKRIYQRLLSDKINSADIKIEQVLEELKFLPFYSYLWGMLFCEVCDRVEGVDYLSFPIPSKSGVAYGITNSKGFLSVKTYLSNKYLRDDQKTSIQKLKSIFQHLSSSILSIWYFGCANGIDQINRDKHFDFSFFVELAFHYLLKEEFNPHEYLSLYNYNEERSSEVVLHNMANEMRNLINSSAPPISLSELAKACNTDLNNLGEKALEETLRRKGTLQKIKEIPARGAYGFRPWKP